ncbi:orotidine 5'-phosphate decarboxylase / HUMPS family protein [Ligilactobacillus pobuzihii]|uniref:3-hexulose-6-phosphate synthase n=1 Tax=Ligilactobacillus pobuzihii TaxID=449659 RepID=A0A0R2LR85_9LACO|nr:orotidine 5'-phosphate decarboxylase / HUMPS family protein [Ligilactobacillus pobuzihii]KRK09714.1 3-hexulose-6-phosphate synthase [Ligilactobacillus pobuzihii E100301 = KCTC 13174]KRO01677.1 3-hexulose-6-phosphate synthase [Ligilactobacillus pobuzihii]GEN48711.1 3-hexulose-6-phosphate synthase [Ligilactobacillus pobuzihii]
MKLQAAIDRVSLKQATQIAHQLDGIVDIIELGTSIIKDYGLETLKAQDFKLTKSELLLDLKTNDEGKYEFERGYQTSADILTVMGGSDESTIQQTYAVAQAKNKKMLIDLIETSDKKINQLTDYYQNAIFGLHHSKDSTEAYDAVASIEQFVKKHPTIKNIAVAGGIDLDQAQKIAQQGLANTIIVGGKIVGATDPVKAAQKFMEVIK